MDGVLVQPYTVTSLSITVAQRYSVLVEASCKEGDGNINRAKLLFLTRVFCKQVTIGYELIRRLPNNLLAMQSCGTQTLKRFCQQHIIRRPLHLQLHLKRRFSLHLSYPLLHLPQHGNLCFCTFSFMNSFLNRRIVIQGGPQGDTPFFQMNGVVFELSSTPLYQAVVNSQLASLKPNTQVVTLNYGEVIDLLFHNHDDGGHPFHLHGHTFWVVCKLVMDHFRSQF